MPLDGFQNEAVDRLLRRGTSRGLRRSLSPLGGTATDTVLDASAQQYDPTRFQAAFAQDAQQTAADVGLAHSLNQRDDLAQQVRNPALDPAKRDMMQQTLDRLPKWGSVAARFDPRDQNSVASRFGDRRSLFRNI